MQKADDMRFWSRKSEKSLNQSYYIQYQSVFSGGTVKPTRIFSCQLSLMQMKASVRSLCFFCQTAFTHHKHSPLFEQQTVRLWAALLLQLMTLSTCNFSPTAAAHPHGAASMRNPPPASIRQTDREREWGGHGSMGFTITYWFTQLSLSWEWGWIHSPCLFGVELLLTQSSSLFLITLPLGRLKCTSLVSSWYGNVT